MGDAPLFTLICGFFAFYAGLPGPTTKEDELPFDWEQEVVSVRLGRREMAYSKEFSELRGVQGDRLSIEDPFERTRNLRDVMSTKTEKLLYQQIKWMDEMCRSIVFQQQTGMT